MKPPISVVMPAYNAEKTIANAINSILNQTKQDFELIIIDDASEDNTQKVVEQFKDERIHYLKLGAHMGLVYCRNLGNQMTEFDIIAIQDADDLSLPDRLEKCVDMINSGWDIVCHGAYVNMWDNQFQCIGRKYLPTHYKASKDKILEGQYMNGWAVFKKKVWETKPFRKDTEFCYDWMMWLDWIFSDFKIYCLDIGLYEYVRYENSASIQYEKDGRRKQSMEAINKIMKSEYGVEIGSLL